MITPNVYMSRFSVKHLVVMYSGAKYPMATLTFRAKKTTSSARSLGILASMINRLNYALGEDEWRERLRRE